MGNVIAINIGTSFCTASLMDPATGKPEQVVFQGNTVRLPSVVFFPKDAPPIVGLEPYHQLENLTTMSEEQRDYVLQHTILDIKRRMSVRGCFHFKERDYTHDEVLAEIIKRVSEEATLFSPLSGDITDVVLTYPTNFEEWQKEMYKRAARLAGFKKVSILEEPVATTIGCLQSYQIDNAHGVIVYDFGTFSFNASYVQIDHQSFHIAQPPRYVNQCGGSDIDMLLYQHLEQLLQSKFHRPISKVDGEVDFDILVRCRRQKELLSQVKSIMISELIPSHDGETSLLIETMLSRDAFNGMIKELIDKTLKETTELANVVRSANLPLDYILISGGSSKIPLVEETLRSAFPDLKLLSEGETGTTAPIGALYYLNQSKDEKDFVNSESNPHNLELSSALYRNSATIVNQVKNRLINAVGMIPSQFKKG